MFRILKLCVMKKLILVVFSVLISVNTFSQVIVIQVNQVQTFYGDTVQTIDEVLTHPIEVSEPTPKDCRYVLNFNNMSLIFYRDGEYIDEGLFNVKTHNGIHTIQILEDGFNFGLIINSVLENESVILYQYDNDKVEYMNFTNFEILKSL